METSRLPLYSLAAGAGSPLRADPGRSFVQPRLTESGVVTKEDFLCERGV